MYLYVGKLMIQIFYILKHAEDIYLAFILLFYIIACICNANILTCM